MTRSIGQRSVTCAALTLAAVTLMLVTGCASKGDGTYYTVGVNGTDNHPVQLVIDGDTVTHTELECNDAKPNPKVTSTGELDEKRTRITWTVAGSDMRNDRKGTEPVTINKDSVAIDEDAYVRKGSPAAKATLEKFKAYCAKQ